MWVGRVERRWGRSREGGDQGDVHCGGAGREQGGEEEVGRALLAGHGHLLLTSGASFVRQGGQDIAQGVVALVLADILAGEHVVPEGVDGEAAGRAWSRGGVGADDGEAEPPRDSE
jgi:hypothetical protein